MKGSDGLCGVCTTYDASRSAQVEHRDFVLGQNERQYKVILCRSRLRRAGEEPVLDL